MAITESRSPEQTQFVIDSVRQRFNVVQEFLREDNALEFHIDASQKETKSSFLTLLDELRKTGDSAMLRRTDHGLLLIVFRKPPRSRQNLKRPLILLIATIITILADGFLRLYLYPDPLAGPLNFSSYLFVGITYAIALLAIIGIHEMGHKVASWHHKMDSSWPYFIPGIPGVWPTMGALISARDVPSNRDSLFDLGISGPIAGLIVTIVVSIFAVASAHVAPPPSNASLGPIDIYTSFLAGLLIKSPNGNYVLTGYLFDLLYFAYSIGFLLTFVNLLPAWQLDGGHIANSAVSPRVHKWLTYISALIMLLTQFWLMAILVVFFYNSAPSLRPLDDVSPLSSKRKVFFALVWVLSAGLYFLTIMSNAYFGGLQLIH